MQMFGSGLGVGNGKTPSMLQRRHGFARSSRSCAINSGVEVDAATSVFAAGAAAAGAGSARSRPFLLTIWGAMMPRSTLAEPQIGQLTSLRFSCCS